MSIFLKIVGLLSYVSVGIAAATIHSDNIQITILIVSAIGGTALLHVIDRLDARADGYDEPVDQ